MITYLNVIFCHLSSSYSKTQWQNLVEIWGNEHFLLLIYSKVDMRDSTTDLSVHSKNILCVPAMSGLRPPPVGKENWHLHNSNISGFRSTYQHSYIPTWHLGFIYKGIINPRLYYLFYIFIPLSPY